MKKRVLPLLLLIFLFVLSAPVQAANVTDFSDVKSSDWHYPAVSYAVNNGLFNGTSDATFSPNATMTRGMLVTVLGRSANVDTSAFMLENFADVKLADYYAPYVQWAYANGIVSGTGGGMFSPNANVTREQMAKILYGYCAFLGQDMNYDITRYLSFGDTGYVANYAIDAMKWATDKGIINGTDGMLNPQEAATRAQVATIFMNAKDILAAAPGSNETGEEAPGETVFNNDEITDHPTGTSSIDERGGYWDFDMARAILDATNDIREENGLDRLGYSVVLQEWASQRAAESYLIDYDRNQWKSPHYRPNGEYFNTIGTGCTMENAMMPYDYHSRIFYKDGVLMIHISDSVMREIAPGLSETIETIEKDLTLPEFYKHAAKKYAEVWYNSSGHKRNMLSWAECTAVGVYICDGEMHVVQLYNELTATALHYVTP